MSQAAIEVRPGQSSDWSKIVEFASPEEITQMRWAHWLDTPDCTPLVALDYNIPVGSAVLRVIGPGELWVEGVHIADHLLARAIAEALVHSLLDLYRQHGTGAGTLRMRLTSDDEIMHDMVTAEGFRHRATFAYHQSSTRPARMENFKVMRTQHLDMVMRYLRSSPMYRANKYAEHYGTVYVLNDQRIESYLSQPTKTPVLGWRQFEQLHGLVIGFLEHPPTAPPESDNPFYIGYLAAPDDTTMTAMLQALRAIAFVQKKDSVRWAVPLSVGLEAAIERSSYQPLNSPRTRLYELPLRTAIHTEPLEI